ncbi:SIR2 family protein [Pseudobacillus sp. FSL P4-0506]|uniref:SIR2 family protein n=1 Tax=Pseudobacillus sp. FSL P4-0506 TaxID=2921576 RepID=UPI0030F96D36
MNNDPLQLTRQLNDCNCPERGYQMDEKPLSLAFSVEANRGVYALLLGSGISYSAGIPTGRGILRELCRRIMCVNGANESDPFAWYEKRYGKAPLYNEVIELLAKTSSERNGLLKEFFEPTLEEVEQKQKVPTDAHYAIAKLVQRGYVKVIVTTNFDRLLEHALDEHNVQYQTLYHDTDIEGMKPLAHADCTVLKVNGDYRDTRFKNITGELDNYTLPLAQLLRRVFDEYGIIVSGWSAEWDTALRELIKSVKGRRYSWYWHAFSEKLTPYADELISFRDANKIIDPKGADHFFTELYENVINIAKVKKVSPENIQVKTKRMKRYIQDRREIELREMLTDQTRKVVSFLFEQRYTEEATAEALSVRAQMVAEKSKTLAMLVAILTYYMRTPEQAELLIQTAERLTGSRHHFGNPLLLATQEIPLQAIFYSTGISAVMKKNYQLLNKLFTLPKVQDPHRRQLSFLAYTSTEAGLDPLFQKISGKETHLAPTEVMFTYPYLKSLFIEARLAFDEQEFEQHFDQFELLRAIKCRYMNEVGSMCGQFGYKENREHLIRFLNEGAETEDWPALAICDGRREKFTDSLEKLAEDLNEKEGFNGKGLLYAYTKFEE